MRACVYSSVAAVLCATQELRDRWLPQFRSSKGHTALVDHLRVSYPVSLSQLLTEGPFNDCLNSFIYDSGAKGGERVRAERDWMHDNRHGLRLNITEGVSALVQQLAGTRYYSRRARSLRAAWVPADVPQLKRLCK